MSLDEWHGFLIMDHLAWGDIMPAKEFNLSDLNGVNGFTINGISASDRSGMAVDRAGDVNGDGRDDIVISAYFASPGNRSQAGQVYIVFGNDAESATLELSSLNGTNGVIINGIAVNDWTGRMVSSAGDLNDDGFADVAIAARSSRNVYVILGHNTTWPAIINLSAPSGVNIVTFRGMSGVAESVAFAGDVNGDRIGDLIMSDPLGSPGGVMHAGECFVVFGHPNPWPATVDVTGLTGVTGFRIIGTSVDHRLGLSLGSAGDINRDGINDLIVADESTSQALEREAYLLFGRRGWPAVIDLTTLTPGGGVVFDNILSSHTGGSPRTYAVTAGDANHDGTSDLIIGSRGDRALTTDQFLKGRAFLVFGHNGTWSSRINVSEMNASIGVEFEGEELGDLFGWCVNGVGDINDDGVDDAVVGAFMANVSNRSYAGKTYAIFGRDIWTVHTNIGQLDRTQGVMISGIAAHDRSGYAVTQAGDFNGDGKPDILIGADGASPHNKSSAGQTYVIFGGAEVFSANEFGVVSGGSVVLDNENLAVIPLVDRRRFTVTNVTHGHFALASNQSVPVTSFTQLQVNQSEVVFVHDGSDQAPGYTVFAEGITRVFSDVHPQRGHVAFSLATTSTTGTSQTSTVTTSSTESSTTTSGLRTGAPSAVPTRLPIVAPTDEPSGISTLSPIVLPTGAPFASPTGGPSAAFISIAPMTVRITTGSPTTVRVNDGVVIDDNSGGSSGDSSLLVGAIVGGLIATAVLLIVGFWYGRYRERKAQRALLPHPDNQHTVAMMVNPAYKRDASIVGGGEASSQCVPAFHQDGTTTGGRDGYLMIDMGAGGARDSDDGNSDRSNASSGDVGTTDVTPPGSGERNSHVAGEVGTTGSEYCLFRSSPGADSSTDAPGAEATYCMPMPQYAEPGDGTGAIASGSTYSVFRGQPSSDGQADGAGAYNLFLAQS